MQCNNTNLTNTECMCYNLGDNWGSLQVWVSLGLHVVI